MRIVVVGAGPVGLFCALVQARAGHDVTLVERDAGPTSSTQWRRRGVMQFEHPHLFRYMVRDALADDLPDVLEHLLDAGAALGVTQGLPPEFPNLQCRRSLLERCLRAAAESQPGLHLVIGHAEDVTVEAGRVSGVRVDGATVPADLVLAASGRASQFAEARRAPGEVKDCGFAYVSRMYQAAPGAEWPSFPIAGAVYDGYEAIAFPHDNRILSALIIRRSTDKELTALRHTACFEAAAAQIPVLAPWTAPGAWSPVTDVMVGGRLTNSYRDQRDDAGKVPVPGLVFVGDAVSTTNPSGGRGVALGLLQARQLLALLAEHEDVVDATEAFERWCLDNVHPWYVDHVDRDAWLLRRFAGEQPDPDGPLVSDVVLSAAMEQPTLMPKVVPYIGMRAQPQSLASVEGEVRTMLREGWRPAYAKGPTRDELVDLVREPAAVG